MRIHGGTVVILSNEAVEVINNLAFRVIHVNRNPN